MTIIRIALRALLIASVCLMMQPQDAAANNIAVTNVSLKPLVRAGNYTYVKFDLTWDNSWRTSTYESNWDAAWVFVKYCFDGSNWNHAGLATSGHYAPAGSVIDTPSDGKGVFIYRSTNGIGNVSYSGVMLRWNYSGTGLETNENVKISVHAIEMVYIPEGSFELGSGGTEGNHFYQYPTETNTYTVDSTNAITVGTNSSNLYYTADNAYAGDRSGPIPSAFPKGYKAFYCMKYEISQGQYADFLNKLTYTQATNRYPNKNGQNRHTISGSYTNYSATVPDRACNWLSWADGAAYADWAALRPMTELEFEKACRGTEFPVPNEHAWGSTSIYGSAYTLTNANLPNEKVSNLGIGTGNASYDTTDGSINGPLRCGIFAASITNPTRAEAGATYYGVMEMSGNVWEKAVTVGNATGRAFTGTHGGGSLSATGDATNDDWPGSDADGVSWRGSSWGVVISDCQRVSDRYVGGAYIDATRYYDYGFRGGRSAP